MFWLTPYPIVSFQMREILFPGSSGPVIWSSFALVVPSELGEANISPDHMMRRYGTVQREKFPKHQKGDILKSDRAVLKT